MKQAFGPYPARCSRVIDGDTIALDIDLGFDHLISALDWNSRTRLVCRVEGINAPELSTDAGKASLAFALTLIKPGDLCKVISYGWDKYGGRYDGSITLADGRDYAKAMIDAGQAAVYP